MDLGKPRFNLQLLIKCFVARGFFSTDLRRGVVASLKSAACVFSAVRRQVDILELKDLEKEYMLSRCRLTLAQHHPPSAAIAGTPTTKHTVILLQWAWLQESTNLLLFLFLPYAGSASAVEMVALLVQTGLFDSALTLCQIFKLSLTPIFEGLTYK